MRARLSLPHAGHQERGGLSGMGELLPAQGLVMFVDTLVRFCAHKVKQLMSWGGGGGGEGRQWVECPQAVLVHKLPAMCLRTSPISVSV